MPESKRRPEAAAKKAAARRVEESERGEQHRGDLAAPNPPWFVPVLGALLILGVLWIATFYITSGEYPIKSIRYWNLGIGMGLMLAGFGMATRWR